MSALALDRRDDRFAAVFGHGRSGGAAPPPLELSAFAGRLAGPLDHDRVTPVLRELSFALQVKCLALWRPSVAADGRAVSGQDRFECLCVQPPGAHRDLYRMHPAIHALLRDGIPASVSPDRLSGERVCRFADFERETGYSYARLAPAGPTWPAH